MPRITDIDEKLVYTENLFAKYPNINPTIIVTPLRTKDSMELIVDLYSSFILLWINPEVRGDTISIINIAITRYITLKVITDGKIVSHSTDINWSYKK